MLLEWVSFLIFQIPVYDWVVHIQTTSIHQCVDIYKLWYTNKSSAVSLLARQNYFIIMFWFDMARCKIHLCVFIIDFSLNTWLWIGMVFMGREYIYMKKKTKKRQSNISHAGHLFLQTLAIRWNLLFSCMKFIRFYSKLHLKFYFHRQQSC